MLQDPVGDRSQGFGSHGLLDAAVFVDRTGGTVLEEVVQSGQFGGLKILVAGVLESLLDFEALQSGQLGGAALDVYSNEPLKDSPLTTLPNVLLTPHIAGSTNEAQEAVGVQIASQVREYLLKGVIQNAVNMPSISEEEYHQMLPYIAAR